MIKSQSIDAANEIKELYEMIKRESGNKNKKTIETKKAIMYLLSFGFIVILLAHNIGVGIVAIIMAGILFLINKYLLKIQGYNMKEFFDEIIEILKTGLTVLLAILFALIAAFVFLF